MVVYFTVFAFIYTYFSFVMFYVFLGLIVLVLFIYFIALLMHLGPLWLVQKCFINKASMLSYVNLS